MNIFHMPSGPEKDTMTSAPIPARLKKNKRVAIITADHVQDLEFFYPYYRLNEAGYDVDIITADGGAFKGEKGFGLPESLSIEKVSPGDYALVYLPGGKAPEELRKNETVIQFVQNFAALGLPIGAFCHGPQILMTAGLTRGRQMACWPDIQDELEEFGGTFVNEALVIDGQFITGRMPGDLPRFMVGVIDALEGRLDLTQSRDERKSA